MRKLIYFLIILSVSSQIYCQCIIPCNTNIGYFSDTNARTIAYDNIGSAYHSTYAAETGYYTVWGEAMSNSGTGNVLTPQVISSTNYPALTGTILTVGIGSNSGGGASNNPAQIIVLTNTGLFAGGGSNAVLNSSVLGTTTFQKLTVNGKTDGLPAGLTPDSVKMMFVTHRSIILTSCGGYVYVLSQDSNIRGDLGSGSNAQWSQVMESAGVPLSNVIVTRGGGLFAFALKSDNTIWTWGDSVLIGNGTSAITRNYAVQMTKPAGLTRIKMIQATRNLYSNSNKMSYYILGIDKKVYSLGANNAGQLGDNTTTFRSVWVNALEPVTNTVINNAQWISSNEHDPNYPNLGIIKSNGQSYTCGINNGSMIGRTVSPGTNNLNYPSGIVSTDTIVHLEVGGHTSAFIKLNTQRYGYLGHAINGSIGSGTSASSTITPVNFSITPIVSICGTFCDTPKLYHLPYNCRDTQATFVIKSKNGAKIKYILNGVGLDSLTINSTDSAFVVVNHPVTDNQIKIVQVINLLCSLNLSLSDTVRDRTTKDSFLTICKNYPVIFKGNTIDTTGIYRDTTKITPTCDSFFTLYLTVHDTSSKKIFDTICNGNFLFFNDLNRDTAGLFKDTLLNFRGCDSFVYLNLYVKDTSRQIIFDTICKNHPLLFNNEYRDASVLYRDTLINKVGCDSFLYLYLTVKDTSSTILNRAICENDSIFFNDSFRKKTGLYLDTMLNAAKCDSFIYLNLTVNDTSYVITYDTICRNDSIKFGGVYYKAQGIYFDTLKKKVTLCDSIIERRLEIFKTDTFFKFDSICRSGDSLIYRFNNLAISDTGVYWDTLRSIRGCDSIIKLRLDFFKRDTTTLLDSICKNGVHSFNNKSILSPGIYWDTLQSRHGCDSFINLILKLDTTKDTTYLSRNLCKRTTFVFNNMVISTPGIYWDTLVSKKGCDSFINLNVILKDSTISHLTQSICQGDSFKFNDSFQKKPGTYLDTLVNQHGCDSFIFMTLKVNPTHRTDIFDSICHGSVFNFHSLLLTQSGEYRHTLKNQYNCDSVIVLHLYVSPDTIMDTIRHIGCSSVEFRGNLYSFNETIIDKFLDSRGCDSLWRFHLIIIRPTPITLPEETIEFCDELSRNGKRYSTSLNLIETVKTKDALQCDSVYRPLNLVKYITPKVTITPSPVREFYRKGDIVQLESSKVDSILWSNGSRGRKIFPKVVKDTQIYYVIGWNYDLCKDTTYIIIKTSDSTSSRFPTAFTPNGDGTNDILYFRSFGIEQSLSFKIYNRLGQLLFSASSMNDGWDGNYKGEPQNADVYYYNFEVTTYKGKRERGEGSFLLIR